MKRRWIPLLICTLIFAVLASGCASGTAETAEQTEKEADACEAEDAGDAADAADAESAADTADTEDTGDTAEEAARSEAEGAVYYTRLYGEEEDSAFMFTPKTEPRQSCWTIRWHLPQAFMSLSGC